MLRRLFMLTALSVLLILTACSDDDDGSLPALGDTEGVAGLAAQELLDD